MILELIIIAATGAGLGVTALELRDVYRDTLGGVLLPPGVTTKLKARGVSTLDHLEMLTRSDVIRMGLTAQEADGVEAALLESGRSLSRGRSLLDEL
jgi:hypothetical protein